MSQNRAFIAELQMEAASTRKMLERVPTDKNDWKPHEKSMKLGRLSSHIAELPGWIAMVVTTDELDLSKMDYKPTIATSTEELTALHDTHVNKAIAALESTPDEDFEKMWTLRRGEDVIFAMPKKVVLRSMAASSAFICASQAYPFLVCMAPATMKCRYLPMLLLKQWPINTDHIINVKRLRPLYSFQSTYISPIWIAQTISPALLLTPNFSNSVFLYPTTLRLEMPIFSAISLYVRLVGLYLSSCISL